MAIPVPAGGVASGVLASIKPSSAREWPSPLGNAAFHGVPGRFVEIVAPHTEADPAGLLAQFLTAFGNMVGPGPHFRAEATRHSLNLFSCLVGTTSIGRKGTSWGRVLTAMRPADEDWSRGRIRAGLSSGEGLIAAILDPNHRGSSPDPSVVSAGRKTRLSAPTPGGLDGRLLVLEPEFAGTLRVLGRDGNTLSAIIRQAWDAGNLAVMTRNDPLTAEGAHVSIIGHITMEELLQCLDRIDQMNGFANRFVWLCVARARILPEGGSLSGKDLEPVVMQVSEALAFSRDLGDFELRRDTDARTLWHEVYEGLTEGRAGIFGAATARAAPIVMRLACIYALLDRSGTIRRAHLNAALAVWSYAEASVKYIFGDASGYPLADELLSLLRSRSVGMTRAEIGNHFGRNKRSDEIARALNYLVEHGLARGEREEAERGRPPERWYAVTR